MNAPVCTERIKRRDNGQKIPSFGCSHFQIMNDNLDELKSLVATIKADQQEQKDKAKREAWTKYVSLSMIFLAVDRKSVV